MGRVCEFSEVLYDTNLQLKTDATYHHQKRYVLTTNGCFDILHIGHVRLISMMKKVYTGTEGLRFIIVGVNSDDSVRRLKGNNRPIIPQYERAEMVASLRGVDMVFIFDDETPEEWIGKLKPDKHFKVGYKLTDVPEAKVIKSYGGELVLLDKLASVSTTQIIERIRQ